MTITIRPLRPADQTAWLLFWQDYMDNKFYEPPAASWQRLMLENPPFRGIAAELDGKLAGFALYGMQASTKRPHPDCYLNDLYVAAPARRHGVARALLAWLRREAEAQGWSRLHWNAYGTNRNAQALYDQIATRTEKVIFEINFAEKACIPFTNP